MMVHDRTKPRRRVDQPEPGCFKLRLVRSGPWVAATIQCNAEGHWSATIDGKRGDSHADPAQADGVFRVWHYGSMISGSEHDYLVDLALWARIHAPDSPEANPTRAINVNALPPAF